MANPHITSAAKTTDAAFHREKYKVCLVYLRAKSVCAPNLSARTSMSPRQFRRTDTGSDAFAAAPGSVRRAGCDALSAN
jgi:hypothetical protein